MIYGSPRIRIAGDRFAMVELGDEMSFEMSLLVHGLTAKLRQAKPGGLIELVPCIASVMVAYDPSILTFEGISGIISEHMSELGAIDTLEMDSRIYYVPVMYFDPWTKECVEDYCQKVTQKTLDPDLLGRGEWPE